MVEILQNNPVLVTALVVVIALVSVALTALANKAALRQDVIDLSLKEYMELPVSMIVLGTLFMVAVALGLAWYKGGAFFDFIAGGTLLALVAGALQALQMWFYYRGLDGRYANDGHVVFDRKFSLAHLANQMLTGALLMLFLFLLFGQLAFAGAAFFLFMGFLRYRWYASRGYV